MRITEAERIVELRQQLNEHSLRYHVTNNPLISDDEYDTLFRELVELEKVHPEMIDRNSPTMRVGCAVPTAMRKVKHKVRMLSLDNVETTEKLLKFFSLYRGTEAMIEMKIDGLSLHLSYEKGKLIQAATRGDGYEGEDLTENARTIRTVPLVLTKPVDIEVRGEVYWRISAFTAYNESVPEAERYANPRNGASGMMRLKDSRQTAKARLDFVAYSVPTDLPPGVTAQEALLEYLETLGFRSTMSLDSSKECLGLPFVTTLIEPDEISQAVKFFKKLRKSLDLDTDGLVVKLSSIQLQREAGEGERSPRWAVAYKFPPEAKPTRLLGVVVQVGKTGQIAPVAQLEPVALGGVIVRSASLCNQDELDRLGIDVDDIVLVQRSGETIPKIIGLARPSPNKTDVNKSYQLPKTCPCCHTPLVRAEGQVNLYCPNLECFDQVYARLTFATSKEALDVDGLGESGVRLMMEERHVTCLSDVYAIKDWTFMKPAQRKRVQEGFEKAKNAPLWRKISALCIDDIGKVRAQDLAMKYRSLTEMCLNPDGTRRVIGKVPTANLQLWIANNLDEVERLIALGFSFKDDPKNTGILGGKSFCITGRMESGARDQISDLIEKNGGIAKGAVTKNVDYLVQGDGGGNNKAAAASKWGTAIITEAELYRMIGIPMPPPVRITEENEP